MPQTTSLTLEIWQGLCSKHSVAFGNSKSSCMMSDRLNKKCNSRCRTFSMQGSNLSIACKGQAKSCQELQVHSWLMSRRKLIRRDHIKLLGRKGCIWHPPYQHHHQRYTHQNHFPGLPWMDKL